MQGKKFAYMLSDGTHKVLANFTQRALDELRIFENEIANYAIVAIKGNVTRHLS